MQTIERTPTGTSPESPRPTGDHRPSRWLLAAVLILAVIAFYALGLRRYFTWDHVRASHDGWQAQAAQNLGLALAVFFAVYVAVTALSLPAAAILTLLAGALFGRWLGTGVVSLASTLGATLAFLSSRYLLRDWVQRRFGDRLGPINRGVERDGAYYLFTLRLVPVVPFFLINLGMGLTPIRVGTFALVSWAGMLLGTFLYVNAGTALATLDEPSDLLSTKVLVSLALLGVAPLALRQLVRWQVRPRGVALAVGVLSLVAAAGLGVRTYFRYQTAGVMAVPVREYSNAEYPDDPAHRSQNFGKYDGRSLTLVKKDATHFDFVFEPTDPHVAKTTFRDIDVSLMTPGLPDWAREHPGNQRVALTDRQWNRQQVRFAPDSPHVEITGGDGYEKANLTSVELAKNCLNAGLWELLLFATEDGKKALLYHGWFTFPLGHYKALLEHNTGLPYWRHWYYLEHWFDPAGTAMDLTGLRSVTGEREVSAHVDADERVLMAGEQVGKWRIMTARNVVAWGDFYDGRKVRFASFIPPGRYSVNHPWKNEFWRLDRLERAILRDVRSPATERPLQELELVFRSSKTGQPCRFFVSGIDFAALPQLPVRDYPKGLYMPMGVGVPPFFQGYDELRKSPPTRGPYFSVMLDAEDRWIDHHSLGVDGPVLHRDERDPDRLHVYLLSYERHSLVNHLVLSLKK